MRLTVPQELIEAARAGQAGAMERLLKALWPHAYRIARSIIQNDSLAEDAAQEACAIVYRTIAGLKSPEAFRVWAYRIIAREAVRAAKHHAVHFHAQETRRHADVEARLDVLRALGVLSPDLRAVVILHYYAQLSSSEIGAALGIPNGTVRFRLSSARRRLSQLLAGYANLFPATEACR